MKMECSEKLSRRPCILLGAGGHAKVVLDLALIKDAEVLGVCDPKLFKAEVENWNGLNVLGSDDYLLNHKPEDCYLLNGIGMLPGSTIRRDVYTKLVGAGFFFPVLIHPSACVSKKAVIHSGAQVMAGTVVQAFAIIGENSIVNTRSSVDHDSIIGSHCHIAPGTTICGGVTVGDYTFVGAGTTVLQGKLVSSDKIIKAGSLITQDVL